LTYRSFCKANKTPCSKTSLPMARFSRSAVRLARAHIKPRIAKLAAAFRSRDTSWDGCARDVPKLNCRILESCSDLLFAVITHSAALERRSRKLVVISRIIHQHDYLLLFDRSFLRSLCRCLLHNMTSMFCTIRNHAKERRNTSSRRNRRGTVAY